MKISFKYFLDHSNNNKMLTIFIGLIIVTFILFLSQIFVCEEQSEISHGISYHIPRKVTPQYYDLRIVTDLEEFYFRGKVLIKVLIAEDTSNIILNAGDLRIPTEAVSIKNISNPANSSLLTVISTNLIQENDFFEITTKELMVHNESYLIEIPFGADLKEGLQGYYRSSYVDKATGKTKWIAVTQFQPTHARKAFPCFDEPDLKAMFRITLGHRRHLKSVSNWPLNRTYQMEERKGWIWNEFEISLPMSTYLVAFMISEMEFKVTSSHSGSSYNGIMYRIWTRRDAYNQVDFALDIGEKFLEFYEKYFEIKFPLPKQDLVAIPDFYNGAMENWGLITFRESELLCGSNSTFASKESVAIVIAHELAHQWFGNLVTMKWWSDLWLNEGFATYMEAVAVNHLFPSWNSFQSLSVGNLITVMDIDSFKSSHSISVDIHSPSEIEEVFDSISYMKGAVLIRMMVTLLGEKVFKKGIINYLNLYSFDNADQNSLWDALTNIAKKSGDLDQNMTVKYFMDTWTLQTGYPVITVKRNYEKRSVFISQKRFLQLRQTSESDNSCWVIPLSYTTSFELNFENTKVKHWLRSNETEIENITSRAEDWIIFNIQFGVLYKVNYDESNWKNIAITLNTKDTYKYIHSLNRVQILNDIFDFAWLGDVDYELAFNIVNYLRHEDEYLPWSSGMGGLNKIYYTLQATPLLGKYKKYMRKLIEPLFTRFLNLTVLPVAYEEQKLKVLLTKSACKVEIQECLKQAALLFAAWSTSNTPEVNEIVPEDYREIVYCAAIKYGSEDDWNFLWSMHGKVNSASHRSVISRSLACSRDVWVLNGYLNKLLDKSFGIRQQDTGMIFAQIAANPIGFYLAKEFLYHNIEKLKEVYNDAPPGLLGGFVPSIIYEMTNTDDLKEMKKFISNHEKLFSQSKMAIKQSFENAEVTINWLNKYYDVIGTIVDSH